MNDATFMVGYGSFGWCTQRLPGDMQQALDLASVLTEAMTVEAAGRPFRACVYRGPVRLSCVEVLPPR